MKRRENCRLGARSIWAHLYAGEAAAIVSAGLDFDLAIFALIEAEVSSAPHPRPVLRRQSSH